MLDDETTQSTTRDGISASRALQHRLSRRTLFKSAGGLGAGALALKLSTKPAAAWGFDWRSIDPATEYDDEVATKWFELIFKLTHTTPGLSTLPAARAFGYLGVTLYEALVPGLPGADTLAGRLNDLPRTPGPRDRGYHWPTVANHALAQSARELFRMTTEENLAAINALESSFADVLKIGVPYGIIKRSAARGRRVADHIVEWAKTDGGHDGHLTNFPADYAPPVGPGLWIPTPPGFSAAYQPYWGNNRPMVIDAVTAYDPGPPPAFSTEPGSAFYTEAKEVYDTVNSLTEEQRAIALFWNDALGPTVGAAAHWISIVNQVLAGRDATLAEAAEAYARAGMAVSDALIVGFYTKYRYYLIRPVSYIQQHIDAAWGNPLPVGTPPFPEYVSTHSIATRAFAETMYHVFGDVSFTDHTHDSIGLAPRTFNSWSGMAEETSISRLYGGIHFRAALKAGLEQGHFIGQAVSAL